MNTITRFYVGNIEDLIGAVESAPVEAIELGSRSGKPAVWQPSSLSAMLVQRP